ncbi:MAG: hypothetical protein AAFY83_05370 [Pseudomonadota bacterium]
MTKKIAPLLFRLDHVAVKSMKTALFVTGLLIMAGAAFTASGGMLSVFLVFEAFLLGMHVNVPRENTIESQRQRARAVLT